MGVARRGWFGRAEMAAKLLDDVLYSRVLECVDIGKLCMVEMDLWAALCEQGVGVAKELIFSGRTITGFRPNRLAAFPPRRSWLP